MIVLATPGVYTTGRSSGRYMMVTGIGSFPFTDVDETLDLIFTTSKQIPFWPQLPKRSPDENMYATFLEGVPCVVFDETRHSLYVDTRETDGIEKFYEDFLADNYHALAISRRMAPGFYRFLERIGDIKDDVRFIKGQLTGPFSMGLGLKDEKGKPIIYNSAFFDIIKKALQMKARWMVSAMEKALPGKDIIIFFDEPHMVSFGSAYVSISRGEAIALFNEVLEKVPAKGGVHCCGNTDWSVFFETKVDIINYDAFNFMDTLFYYPEELKKFLQRGGWISPGIVPASEAVLSVSIGDVAGLLKNFRSRIESINPTGARDWIITTSCGLGTLDPEVARHAMDLLRQLADATT
jgi:methionine synthase II (cobalamin-independent)